MSHIISFACHTVAVPIEDEVHRDIHNNTGMDGENRIVHDQNWVGSPPSLNSPVV